MQLLVVFLPFNYYYYLVENLITAKMQLRFNLRVTE